MPVKEIDDKENFTIIDADGNSEECENPTPPPPAQAQIKEEENIKAVDILETPSIPVPLPEALPSQLKNSDSIKALLFGCLFCCKAETNHSVGVEIDNYNQKGVRYENS